MSAAAADSGPGRPGGSSAGADTNSLERVGQPVSPADFDRRRLWSVMCLLGIGTLAAFNVCINAIPYFETYLGPDVAYRISAAFTVIQLGLQPIILVYGHRTSPLSRIIGACATQAIIMILAPLLGIRSDFWITIVMAAAGAATAVLEASVFGFLSAMPAYASAGLLVGEAAVGLAASLAQLLVKGLIPGDASRAAALYFGTASAVLAACAGASWWLRSHPVVLATGANLRKDPFAVILNAADSSPCDGSGVVAFDGGNSSAAAISANPPEAQLRAQDGPPTNATNGSSGLVADAAAAEAVDLRPLQLEPSSSVSPSGDWSSSVAVLNPLDVARSKPERDTAASLQADAPFPVASVVERLPPSQPPHQRQLLGPQWLPTGVRAWLAAMWRVIEAIWPGALAVLLNFVATFLVLPGVMASIPYRGGYEPFQQDGGWWTVSLFALFSTGDLLGRAAAPHVQVGGQRRILAYSIIKLIIAPPLVLGAARGWSFLGTDAGAVAAVTVLSVTNGHLASLGMVAIPQAVKSPRDGELAGFVSVVFLHAGIALGSVLALIFQ